jgi:uncharacterized protein YjbI with pentapeptide repeats
MIQRSTTALIAILTVGSLFALAVCIVILPRLLHPPLSDVELATVPSAKERIELQQAQGALENNARATLLQGVGGILVIVGLMATWQQLTISREGQITDRFTKAIDQLGDNKQEVRVGGIRALERIALNSRKDRATIAYVLGAFVRVHAPRAATATVNEDVPWLQQRAADVQTAMWVLGRRMPADEPIQLYLSWVDLRRVHLAELSLPETQLRHANLARAWMPRVELSHSDLRMADLHLANLEGALLSNANLQGANLQGANLCGANMRLANLQGANLRATNLQRVQLEGADITDTQSDAQTVWPPDFNDDRLRDAGVLIDAELPPAREHPDLS